MHKLHNFIAQRNFNRPGLAILVDLIKLFCAYEVSLPHTRFGVPQAFDLRPDVVDDVNTFLPAEIDSAWDASFPGANGFAYYRLPIDLLNGASGVTVDLTGRSLPVTVHQILPLINTAAGVQLTTDDVENTSLTNLTDPVKLQAKAGSLVWCNVAVPQFGPLDLLDQTVLELPGLSFTPAAPPA